MNFKDVNVSLPFQSRKLVHMPGVHCHPGASCTVAVLLCTLQDCIPTVSQYLYFRPRMSGSKCKSSSDAAGACSVAQLCQLLSRVRLFTTPWTVACQAPLSMGFYREEYCSGLPLPPPGDLSHPGIEPKSPASPATGRQNLY